MLEIINSCLTNSLHHNPNLVYALLYKRDLFEQFRTHPSFQDIMQNIDLVSDLLFKGCLHFVIWSPYPFWEVENIHLYQFLLECVQMLSFPPLFSGPPMWLILGNIFYSVEPEGFGDACGKEFPTCDTSLTSFKEEQCQLLLTAPCYKPVFQRRKSWISLSRNHLCFCYSYHNSN